jgi:DHA2 family multidrug resistance protein
MLLDQLITNQGTMVAYIDDFHLMMILTLLTIPFLLILRRSPP